MNEIPGDLKFMKSHEWARVEDNGTVTVGISDHAQGLLGDLVYVELPSVGDKVSSGNACAVVESVKAASDVYAPVSGEVVAVNAALGDKPETIQRRRLRRRLDLRGQAEQPRRGIRRTARSGCLRGSDRERRALSQSRESGFEIRDSGPNSGLEDRKLRISRRKLPVKLPVAVAPARSPESPISNLESR